MTLNKYTSRDLNWVLKFFLTIMILLGVVNAMLNFYKNMTTIGIAYSCLDLIGAIIAVAANILLLQVNIWGFYIHIISYAIISVITICLDIESGITYIISASMATGIFFLILQIRSNGISAWKMMKANRKGTKNDTVSNIPMNLNTERKQKTDVIEDQIEQIQQHPVEDSIGEEIQRLSEDNPANITPPPITQIIDANVNDTHKTNNATPKDKLHNIRFNVFTYITMVIFAAIQVVSIIMDSTLLSNWIYWWDPSIEICRIILASGNILLILLICLLRRKGLTFILLTISCISMIFMVDPMSEKYEFDERSLYLNLMLFLSACLPLFITLFLKKQKVSGYEILFPKFFVHKSKPFKYTSISAEKQEVSKESTDRYTILCKAISPANFLEPYSPYKVKLANELLEALIQNKDNEIVISLIEEKAKEELGVNISDWV